MFVLVVLWHSALHVSFSGENTELTSEAVEQSPEHDDEKAKKWKQGSKVSCCIVCCCGMAWHVTEAKQPHTECD